MCNRDNKQRQNFLQIDNKLFSLLNGRSALKKETFTGNVIIINHHQRLFQLMYRSGFSQYYVDMLFTNPDSFYCLVSFFTLVI